MWGFGGARKDQKQPTPSKQTTKRPPAAVDPSQFDYSHLLSDNVDIDDDPAVGELNDADLNDADLLSQLSALSMASAPPKPKLKPQPKPQPKAPDTFDIEQFSALTEGDDDIEVELTEEDMNDPKLLSQLEGLGGLNESSPAPAPPTKPAPAIPQPIPSGFATASPPERAKASRKSLPSEKARELMNMGFSQRQAEAALAKYDENLERATNFLLDGGVVGFEEEAVAESTTVEAVVPPPPPKKEKEELLVPLATVTPTNPPVDPPLVPPKPATPTLSSPSKPHPPPQPKSQPPTSPSPPQPTTPRPDTSRLESLLAQRQQQYKKAALHYKGLGNIAVAKAMVGVSKEMLKTAVAVRKGEIADLERCENEVPPEPDMGLGSGKEEGEGKIRGVGEVVDILSGGEVPTYDHLESTLTYQIDTCHNLALQYRSPASLSKKPSSSSASATGANPFRALEKTFAADLASLRSLRDHARPLPQFHYQDVTYKQRSINSELTPQDLEIRIVRAKGLGNQEVAPREVEAFVQYDLNGWPPEGSPQVATGKGETPVAAKGMEPEFNYSTIVSISRTNRAFSRYVARKKATFEVFHNKFIYGFVRRPVSLGKVAVEMEPLLTKSTIEEIFELQDSSRKRTGAKLELRIALSEPINGEDIITRHEKWLVVDDFNTNIYALLAAAELISQEAAVVAAQRARQQAQQAQQAQQVQTQQAQAQAQAQQVQTQMQAQQAQMQAQQAQMQAQQAQAQVQAVEKMQATENVLAPAPEPAPATPKTQSQVVETSQSLSEQSQLVQSQPVESRPIEAKQPAAAGAQEDVLEQAEEELNSVDLLVSNMVLEHELTVINAQITTLTSRNQPVPDDLTDRKQALDIKMNLLVVQVQTGLLTMDAYLKNVEERMEKDGKLAVTLKNAGRTDLAKVALRRRKIMRDEVEEVRAALESGGMGEEEE